MVVTLLLVRVVPSVLLRPTNHLRCVCFILGDHAAAVGMRNQSIDGWWCRNGFGEKYKKRDRSEDKREKEHE
jgi:hypothetical protein